jgi:hypothetical protein
MKKLMPAAVALAFLTGTVAIAQEKADPPKQEKAGKNKTAKPKTSKKKAEQPKAQ